MRELCGLVRMRSDGGAEGGEWPRWYTVEDKRVASSERPAGEGAIRAWVRVRGEGEGEGEGEG